MHDDSAITKMQHHFWVTKQTLSRKLGKKEDKYIIASDAELDAKLELFRNIQESSSYLQRVIDKYQERLCSKFRSYMANFNRRTKWVLETTKGLHYKYFV